MGRAVIVEEEEEEEEDVITISYCLFRPRQLLDNEKPPLLVLHGGPSIPSNYLLPIINGVTDRSIILYDQYGCGKSGWQHQKTKMAKLFPSTGT